MNIIFFLFLFLPLTINYVKVVSLVTIIDLLYKVVYKDFHIASQS